MVKTYFVSYEIYQTKKGEAAISLVSAGDFYFDFNTNAANKYPDLCEIKQPILDMRKLDPSSCAVIIKTLTLMQ